MKISGRTLLSTLSALVKADVDVTVLSCPTQLAPMHPVRSIFRWIDLWPDRLFSRISIRLGWRRREHEPRFPHAIRENWDYQRFDFPAALRTFYIDGHGNKGFSGGPVVFVPNGQPQTELRVAGIIANYPTPLREPIVDNRGNPIVDDQNQPVAFFSENPGFVVAMAISHATDLIDANPVGFQLPTT